MSDKNLKMSTRRYMSRLLPSKDSSMLITAKIDDDMIRHYVDEDLFLLEVSHSTTPANPECNQSNPGSPGDPDDPNDSTSIGYDVTLIKLQTQLTPPSPSLSSSTSPATVNSHIHGHVHEVTNS
ncbi:hypothetical protein G9C98_000227 [Cotesia typhae]|uniref:Uncharacterized protein n=1 Tax=Cotesia typhae TaxID=2053667 RepID=A0A8J5US19_9HYME|nr:hypothetical protein G9C98_000227 [Cotesia typhae]